MKLVVFSYKVVWRDHPGGPFRATGGFAHQMQELAQMFDETRLVLLQRPGPAPEGSIPAGSEHLSIEALPEPKGAGIARKIALLWWLPRHFVTLVSSLRWADAVHAVVPGDVGLIGMILALIARKHLFVRHCGTWNDRSTFANRCLAWLLPQIASARNLVLATGGGPEPPSSNPNVHWIFSTALSRATLEHLNRAQAWAPPEPIQLITVGRLTEGKNHHSLVRAMGSIGRSYPQGHLDIVGDGPSRNDLETMVADLSLEDRVTLHGNLTQAAVLSRLQRAHLFVFPTRVPEGFPKAVLEAMACGLPIVAPPVSVLPHLLQFGDQEHSCGLLLEPPDPENISRVVTSALQDPAGLAQMGARARVVACRYSLESWREVIQTLLKDSWAVPLSVGPTS